MIDLDRDGNLFTLTMDEGENRWNTTFVRAFAEAIDEIEASDGPAAVVTTSANAKFFSNGLDLDWISSPNPGPDDPGGDRKVFGREFMTAMSRWITCFFMGRRAWGRPRSHASLRMNSEHSFARRVGPRSNGPAIWPPYCRISKLATCSSSMRYIASRPPSKRSSIRRWKISSSIS